MTKPYKTYPGGKNGNGTYQVLINHVPPHRQLVIGCAGNCGLFSNMKLSKSVIINDIDPTVYHQWQLITSILKADILVSNTDVLNLLIVPYRDWYDQDDVFIYIDLPYLMDSRKSQQKLYDFEVETEHTRQVLQECKKFRFAKIMISHYPCELYDNELAGWIWHDFKSMTRHGLADERIYMNYPTPTVLHDYSYIGTNFTKRQTLKRSKTNILNKLDRLNPLLRNAVLAEINEHYLKNDII